MSCTTSRSAPTCVAASSEETIRDGRAPLLLTKAEVERGVDETNYETLRLERGA